MITKKVYLVVLCLLLFTMILFVADEIEAGEAIFVGEIVEGIEGNAVEGHIEFSNMEEFNIIGKELTLEVWVKPQKGGDANQPFISKGDTQFALLTYRNFIEFNIYDKNREVTGWFEDELVFLEYRKPDDWYNNWQYLAGVFDGNQLKLYLNGEVVAEKEYSGAITGNDYPLNIGRNAETEHTANVAFDRVRIYNRALTSEEINDQNRRPDDSTVLWIDF